MKALDDLCAVSAALSNRRPPTQSMVRSASSPSSSRRSPTPLREAQPGQPFLLLQLGPFVFRLLGPGLGFWLLAPGLSAVCLAAPMLRPFGLSAPIKTSFGFVRRHAEGVHSSVAIVADAFGAFAPGYLCGMSRRRNF